MRIGRMCILFAASSSKAVVCNLIIEAEIYFVNKILSLYNTYVKCKSQTF